MLQISQYIIGTLLLVGIIVQSYRMFKRLSKLENALKDISENKMKEINKIVLEDKHIEKVNTLMDDFIRQASEVYQIMKLSQSSIEYLKPEDAETMKKYIFASIKKNMTEDVVKAIKSIYVIESDEDLDKILDLRINLYMINFLRQYNDVIEEN